MRDGGNICTPVNSGAVDEQFWALICEDEDWLDFVSEPAESPGVPPRRVMVGADRSRSGVCQVKWDTSVQFI